MRADEDVHLARRDPFERQPALLGLRRSGQDRRLHVHAFEHARDRREVLAGENFGRGHHAGLKAVVHGQQHRHQRHEGLAAAHVALQQSVHLESRHGVLTDLLDDALLRAGEREGKLFVVEGVEDPADFHEQKAVVLRQTFRAARLDVELDAQQFVELEPVLRLPEQFGRLREVDVVVGVAQRDQSVAGAHRFGHAVRDVVLDQRPCVADDLVHAFGAEHVREFLGRGVDALHAAFGLAREGLLHGLQFGMRHRQKAAVERRTSEDEVLASDFDAFFDPFDALKPHQFGRSRRVLYVGREAFFTPRTGIGHPRYAGAELQERGRALGDFGDAVDFRAVDVAERIMAQHVAQRADAQLLVQKPGAGFADAAYVFYIVVQILHTTNIMKVGRQNENLFSDKSETHPIFRKYAKKRIIPAGFPLFLPPIVC